MEINSTLMYIAETRIEAYKIIQSSMTKCVFSEK